MATQSKYDSSVYVQRPGQTILLPHCCSGHCVEKDEKPTLFKELLLGLGIKLPQKIQHI